MTVAGTVNDAGPSDSTRPSVARRRWSLRSYLIGLVVVFVATAVAGLVYERSTAESDARQAAIEDAHFGATRAAADIKSAIQLAQAAAASLAANPSVDQVITASSHCSLQFTGAGPFQRGHIDILNTRGEIACSSLPPGSSEYSSAAWLKSALTKPLLAGPITDARSNGQVELVSEPIPRMGVVAVFLNLESLSPALAAADGGPRHLEFVVTDATESTVLSRSIEPERWAGASLTDTSFGMHAGGSSRVDLDGIRRLYGQSRVAGLGWTVYAGADQANAVVAADRILRREFLITLAGLLAFLVSVLVISRRIASPIAQLGTAVRAAITRRADSAALPLDGPREIAALAQDFKVVLGSLERELEAVSRLAAVVEFSDDAIFSLTLDGVVTAWNKGAERIYGYAADQIVGQHVLALAQSEAAEQIQYMLSRVAMGKSAGPYPTSREHRGRGQIHLSVMLSPIKDHSGAVSAVSVVARDVTTERAAEAEQRELRERLERSQRLESLGQLAGGIAHDFNNLLGVILNYSAFVAEETADNAAVSADVARIQAAAERGARLTRQLLIVGRRDRQHGEDDVDLNALVADMHDLLARTIGAHVTLVVNLVPGLPPLPGDRGHIEQILLNLALNARDAMPDGGTLTIDTRVASLDEDYCRIHPEVSPGEFIELAVSDTGIGMSHEVQRHIFEPFFTTKPAGHGTGLGLATIYSIVTTSSGTINVYSEEGVGTTFRVLLPVTAEPPLPAWTDARTGIRKGSGEVILVAEDEPATLEVTSRILRGSGYTVLEASTFEEADSAAKHNELNLLLTDSLLPQLAGRTLADRLRERQPGLRVLFMSGYTEGTLRAQNLIHHHAPVLQKPFTETDLLNAVIAALS